MTWFASPDDAAARLGESEALHGEYLHGLTSLADGALDGAARFASGEGRHGAF